MMELPRRLYVPTVESNASSASRTCEGISVARELVASAVMAFTRSRGFLAHPNDFLRQAHPDLTAFPIEQAGSENERCCPSLRQRGDKCVCWGGLPGRENVPSAIQLQ